MKCTIFLFTFSFYTCAGLVLHTHARTGNCHTRERVSQTDYYDYCTQDILARGNVTGTRMLFVCTHMYPYVTRMNSSRVLVTIVRDSSIKTAVIKEYT